MLETIKEKYRQMQSLNGSSKLTAMEQTAFEDFNSKGIPTVRNEEWKYTRISSVLKSEFSVNNTNAGDSFSAADLDAVRLPGYHNANELVFINGLYSSSYSTIRSKDLLVMSLAEATESTYQPIVAEHLGRSGKYIQDGMHALNTAFVQEGIYLHIKKGMLVEHPVYIYNITDARAGNILSQPRSLVYVGENAQVQLTETYITLGASESFTNQVMEVVVEQGAIADYYKIQNDAAHTNQVSTTFFRQVGKSVINAVTITLNGGIIRNNLDIALEAANGEAHLYGLYFLKGQTHADNHTVVDNVMPGCLSNEMYKGVMADQSTAVFNGKIFVQQPAQKTNAFQSNKNILLSDTATVNTKPQLEIFADDVKCSHGCTVGQLDEEGLFYLRSRGVSEKTAQAMLIHAFAIDILEHIKPVAIRDYVDQLIEDRLQIFS